MESSNFNTVVVRDSRIQDVSTKVDYKLFKGAAQNNYQQFKAQTETVTNLNFNVQIPSENLLIDREVTISAEPTFKLVVPAYEDGKSTGVVDELLAFAYGHTEALNQFPLNSLLSNATMTINSTSMSVNTQDILHTLLRATEEESLTKYNCPHMADKRFKKYSDMILTGSNPLKTFLDAKEKVIPRGAHPLKRLRVIRSVNNVVAQDYNSDTNTSEEMLTALTSTSAATNSWEIYVTFKTTEPLLFMSPFIYGDQVNNSAGLYGVNAMSFVFNLDNTCKRLLSSASPHTINISLDSMRECHINLNLLTVQSSDLLAPKNVVPLVLYERSQNTNSGTITANNAFHPVNANAVALSQIPNRIFIIARKPMHKQTIKDSNSFWPIRSLDINFNNISGILSSATAEDLYKMSVANGSKQDWYEFLGEASALNGVKLATSGSIVIINPAKDMNLPDYLSNGSNGQFSFQFRANVKNPEGEDMAPELLTIFEYNGIFITQAGMSSVQSSLLTKDIVINSTMNQFGESENYIKSFGRDNFVNVGATSLKNVPLLNKKKASGAEKIGSGVRSGAGAFSGGSSSVW